MRFWLIVIFVGSMVSCRNQKDESDPFPSDLDRFDASLPDGSVVEQTAACLDERPRFDNNFSPAFGGNTSVDVEVVHYSSFSCSHCADFAAFSHALWRNRTDFQERARVFFHHMGHSFRHRAAVAAFNQGEGYFWEVHDFIYEGMLTGATVDDDAIVEYARDTLNLDMERFDRDVHSDKTYAFLRWDIEQGLTAGVVATPTVYVCGNKISWLDLENKTADKL